MTVKANAGLSSLLRQAHAILLDFDGPVCTVFAGLSATTVADDLRRVLSERGHPTEPARELGPHELLTYAATLSPDEAKAIEDNLEQAELAAVATSSPTPGAAEFLGACRHFGKPVVIVSNNNADAIASYLARQHLSHLVEHVEGRDTANPHHMKPHPWTIERALARLAAQPSSCVLIGDAVTDLHAAAIAEVPAIGYANRPNKVAPLEEAGALVVVTSMFDLASRVASESRPPR
jgi:HAD superfamily hydrolase (TIGR01509 family)